MVTPSNSSSTKEKFMPSTDRGGASTAATPARPAPKAEATMMKAVAVFPGTPNSMPCPVIPPILFTVAKAAGGGAFSGWGRRGS